MGYNPVAAVKGALMLLSLIFGPIVLVVVLFAVFFTTTTTVYAAVAQASQTSMASLTLRDLLAAVSTPRAIENMNMGNVGLAAVYILVVVLIVVVDTALKESTESLRQKAKLPIEDTLHHYNQNSYDIPLARASSSTFPRMKKD